MYKEAMLVGKSLSDNLKLAKESINRSMFPQALILIYVTIDTNAWINTPNTYSKGEDFQKWSDKYLCPNLEVKCAGKELWGARCGVLHNISSKSESTEKHGVREIHYVWDTQTVPPQKEDFLILHIENLLESLGKGTIMFIDDLLSDPHLPDYVEQKLKRILKPVVSVRGK